MLLERLNTDRSIAPIVTQFVPLKINTDGAEWQEWARRYPPKANTIPIVYVVRADGKELFQESSMLRGALLPNMLTVTLKQAGRVLKEQEISLLEEAVRDAHAGRGKGRTASAVKALLQVNEIGPLGQLQSYAESALECDRLVGELTAEGREILDDVADKLLSQQPDFDSAMRYLQAERTYAPLQTLKTEFATARRNYLRPQVRDLVAQARQLDRILQETEDPRTRERGIEKLQQYADAAAPGSPGREFAMRRLSELRGVVLRRNQDALERLWIPATGTRTVPAKLVGLHDEFVVLRLSNGRTLDVRWERLSNADQVFARLMRVRFEIDKSTENARSMP